MRSNFDKGQNSERTEGITAREGGVQYDYGFRIYNPGIAKFLSVDPLSKDYAWYTPYQFAGNKPIFASDLDGLEEKSEIDKAELHNVFYFGINGKLIRSSYEPHAIPHAKFLFDGKSIDIGFGDPQNDPIQFSGHLEEGKGSDDRVIKPSVSAMQVLGAQDLYNILSNEAEYICDLNVKFNFNETNSFTNVFDLAKDINYSTSNFMDNVSNGMDFGYYLFKDDIIYVTDSRVTGIMGINFPSYHDYTGYNSKNMGNYMFGMTMQILGYSGNEAVSLAHGWNIVNHGMLDTTDDQLSVLAGFEMAKYLYGSPHMKRHLITDGVLKKARDKINEKRTLDSDDEEY